MSVVLMSKRELNRIDIVLYLCGEPFEFIFQFGQPKFRNLSSFAFAKRQTGSKKCYGFFGKITNGNTIR